MIRKITIASLMYPRHIIGLSAVLLLPFNSSSQTAADMKSNRAGVQRFDFKSSGKKSKGIKSLPLLSIKSEERVAIEKYSLPQAPILLMTPAVQKRSPLSLSSVKALNLKPLVPPPSSISPVTPLAPKSIVEYGNATATVLEKLTVKDVPNHALEKVQDLTPDQLQMLRGMIEVEKEASRPTGFARLVDLFVQKKGSPETVALQYGLAAWKLGLFEESRLVHFPLLNSKNENLRIEVAKHLIRTARPGEVKYVDRLEEVKSNFKQQAKSEFIESDQYLINSALRNEKNGDLSEAIELLAKISESSPLRARGLFITAVMKYRMGLVGEAERLMEDAMSKVGPEQELTSSVALTLARLKFQLGKYPEAVRLYTQVKKNHPEWPTAIVENSWAQILNGDFEGAAGNMFSLHTDFFKFTFAPESYVVRSISYINLCQFGDGMKAVKDLKSKYEGLQSFLSSKPNMNDKDQFLLSEVRKLAQSKEQKELALPKMLLIEIARSPEFIKLQEVINRISDEESKFESVLRNLIVHERSLTSNLAKLQDLIPLYRANLPRDAHLLETAENQVKYIREELGLLKQSRKSLKAVFSDAQSRYQDRKSSLKIQAERSLISKLDEVSNSLKSAMDVADILRYEIYAGASQHLRNESSPDSQPKLAAEQNKEKIAAELRKGVKWKFKGEIWEDEIGHFRSSLKNACEEANLTAINSN